MTPDNESHHYPQWNVCNWTPLELGEGPRTLPDGRVVAVDILRGQRWQVDPASADQAVMLQVLDVPLGAVAPIAGSDTALLAAAGDGIAILDGGTLTWLVGPESSLSRDDSGPAPAAHAVSQRRHHGPSDSSSPDHRGNHLEGIMTSYQHPA